jgi:hypothetical protein
MLLRGGLVEVMNYSTAGGTDHVRAHCTLFLCLKQAVDYGLLLSCVRATVLQLVSVAPRAPHFALPA